MTPLGNGAVFDAMYGGAHTGELPELPVVRLRGQSKRLLLVDHDAIVRQAAAAQRMQRGMYLEALRNPPADMRVALADVDSVVYEALDRSDDVAMTSAPGIRTVNRRALCKRRKADRAAKLSRRRNR